MNPFKSLFKKNTPPIPGTEPFRPGSNSPRYAYGFQSPYQQPRILILVDNVRATYFLSFHYVLKQLHETESLAFFVIDSAEIERWTNASSGQSSDQSESQVAANFVTQVIADVQPTLVIFSRYGLPYGDVLPGLFKQQNISTICHIDDDLLNINSDLGAEIQQRQGDPRVQKARQFLLQETDLIYASTPFLGDRFAAQFPQQTVFYGLYAPYLDCLLSNPSAPAKNKPFTIVIWAQKGIS